MEEDAVTVEVGVSISEDVLSGGDLDATKEEVGVSGGGRNCDVGSFEHSVDIVEDSEAENGLELYGCSDVDDEEVGVVQADEESLD